MAVTDTIIMIIIYYKYCMVNISETNEVRDLIFGTGHPWDLNNKMVQSGHQMVPPSGVAPPTCQNLTLTISQKLLKLET